MAQFTNQASVLYNGIVTNSNIVTGEITQVLTAWKDSTVATYQSGDIITYVVSIQNSGTAPYTGLTVTDNLGSYAAPSGTVVPLNYTGDPVLYYINGILQTAPTAAAGPPLVISGIDVPAAGSTVIIYRARLNSYAPLGAGATVENTATISGGGLTDSIPVSNTINADQSTVISIFKALNPTTVVENGQVVYTFTLQNTGATAANAAAGIVVSDTFSPALDAPIAVTLNSAVWPQAGNYTYDAATGVFATVAGTVTVPAATYTQNAATGVWTVTPGVTVLTVTGNI